MKMTSASPLWERETPILRYESEKSYSQFKDQVQQKMDSFIYYFVVLMLLSAFLSSFFLNYPPYVVAFRTISLVFGVTLLFLRSHRPKFCNLVFWSFFCLLDFVYSKNLSYDLQSNESMASFFTGYMLAIIEIISISSIVNHRQRLLVQIIFILNKVISFWDYPLEIVRIIPFLALPTIYSIYFHLFQESLTKQNLRNIYESREKLQRFQSLITEDIPVDVLIVPCNLKSIFYYNKSFCQNLLNPSNFVSSKEALHYLFRDLIIDQKPNISLLEYLQNPINQPLTSETLLITYNNMENKKPLHFETKIRRITWEDQPAYTLILNDITDKYLIKALKLADEQKDKVIATISHELRTPINGILGLLEMASSRTSDETCLSLLQHCESCSKLLRNLVNSILDLSQIRHKTLKVHKTQFRLGKLLAEITSLYLFTAQQKKIELIVCNEVDPLTLVETDELKLIEILINLIGNAFKFTFNGFVKLIVRIDKDCPTKLLFEIEDTGIGIKEQEKPKLFQMFGKLSQSDRNINTHGVGLGLTISNELVKALNNRDHNEVIHFESAVNRGSKFWFRITAFGRTSFSINIDQLSRGLLDNRLHHSVSLIQLEHRGTSATEISLMTESRTGGRILIVDDNPFNLLTASFVVKKFGFEVDTAVSGQACLEMLAEGQKNIMKRYKMVLMDIRMPIMDGLETSQKIKEKILKGELYEIPIVALTAKRIDQKEKIICEKHGMVGTLEKPLVRGEFAKILKELLL